MADLDKLSDAELDALLAQKPQKKTGQKPVEEMSDHELDQLMAASEPKPQEIPEPRKIWGIPETTIEGGLRALPVAGAIGGGMMGAAAGTAMAPGLGTAALGVGGAGLGAAGGEAFANAIRAKLNMGSAPQTREEIWTRPVKEGLLGAAGEGAGQLIKPAVGAIRGAPSAVRGLMTKSGLMDPVVEQAPRFADVGFQPILKENAPEILNASKRIGGPATPGMLSSNKNIQNLENVLSQSPTLSGEKVRNAYDPIFKGLDKSTQELAPMSSVSRGEAGDEIRRGLMSKIGEKADPLSASYQNIQESAKVIQPDPISLDRAADRLLKQDVAEFATLPQGQAVNKYADLIRGAKTLDSLKQLRSSAGSELRAAYDSGNTQLARGLEKVNGAITRLERRQILKSAIESAPTKLQGEGAAKELIDQIKTTNKGWRELMTQLQGVAKAGGIKKIANPQHLAKIIDDMPAPQIADRFFNTKNYEGLQKVKEFVPEEFEVLRQHRLGQIADKVKGNPRRLVDVMGSMDKEARQILFGEKSEQMLKDMQTVLKSMPDKVGPSGTPGGQEWFRFTKLINPANWGNEAQDAYSYMLLQGKKVPTPKSAVQAVGRGLLSPKLTRPAGLGLTRKVLSPSQDESTAETNNK